MLPTTGYPIAAFAFDAFSTRFQFSLFFSFYFVHVTFLRERKIIKIKNFHKSNLKNTFLLIITPFYLFNSELKNSKKAQKNRSILFLHIRINLI